jgi:hypothetical protein
VGEDEDVGEDEGVSEVQTPRTADHEETDSNPVSLRDEFTGNEVCHSDVKTPSLCTNGSPPSRCRDELFRTAAPDERH